MTPKQTKLLELIIENYGKKGSTKPLGELIKLAGYSEASSINPKLIITEEMKTAIQPIIDKMETVRTKAIDKITDEKLSESSARDNAYIADILTKNIQLLNGGVTQRIGIKMTDEERQLANQALENSDEWRRPISCRLGTGHQ